MVVRHRAQGTADAGVLEEQGQRRHQHRSHRRRDQVELGNDHVPLIEEPGNRLIDNTQVEGARLTAKEHRGQALDEECQADGGHEQCDGRLVDQLAQHELFGGDTEGGHDGEGQNDGQPQRRPFSMQPTTDSAAR